MKLKTVRTADYNCAYISKMAVLIIFPVFLQTVINLITLSIEGQGASHLKLHTASPFTDAVSYNLTE